MFSAVWVAHPATSPARTRNDPGRRMRLVLFDLDGTLVTAASERRFAWFLFRRRRIGPRQWLAYVWFTLRWAPHFGRDVGKKNKAYLSGLEHETVAALAREFVASDLSTRLYTPCVLRLRRHQQAGDRIVLLSGTLDVIAQPLAAHLAIERVVATTCSRRGDRFTAAPPEQHPFGQEKRLLAERLCREYLTGLEDTVAYADSAHDLPLLEAVGRPVAVRPDPGLARVARDRGWEIIDGKPGPASDNPLPDSNPG